MKKISFHKKYIFQSIFTILFTIFLNIAVITAADEIPPQITSITPFVVQAGENITITGTRFGVRTASFNYDPNADINEDTRVSIGDLALLAAAYGSKAGDANYTLRADINRDGRVSIGDLALLAQSYGSILGGSFVEFAGGKKSQIIEWEDGRIVTKVPVDAVSGNVTVMNAFGQSNGVFVKIPVPPVLAPIGDQQLDVGTSLNIQLSATDPNTDEHLVYSVSPIPLPANASFNAQTGLFKFVPSAEQAGTYTLTFSVTDGTAADSETISVVVNEIPEDGVTSLRGRILDANSYTEDQSEVPLVGVVVSLIGTGISAVTQSDGTFVLNDIPAGKQVLDLNSFGALPAPDGSTYAGFREEIHLVEKVANVIERPMYLPRIAPEDLIEVNPESTTMVMNSALGIMMEVPPHTAKNGDNSDFTGMLSISEVPKALAPASLPAFMKPGLLITIQPVGVSYASPVKITFPNVDQLPPFTETNLWSLDAGIGQFVVVGKGRVTADGQSIETVSGGIRNNDWHATLPSQIECAADSGNSDNQDNCKCTPEITGSQTHLSNGNLEIRHALPGYFIQGGEQMLEFVYNSFRADPQPVIAAASTIVKESSIPISLSSKIRVANIDQSGEVFTSMQGQGLNENIDETVRQAVQFDAANLPTGRYPYQMSITSHFAQTAVTSFLDGNILINNQINSPFGAGWTLEDLEQTFIDADKNVILTKGDGSAAFYTYDPLRPNGEFVPVDQISDIDTIRLIKQGDFNEDGFIDIAVNNNGGLLIFLNDGEGYLNLYQHFIDFSGNENVLHIEDLNRDDHLDIIMAKSPNGLLIFYGDGTGNFNGPTTLNLSRLVSSVTVFDYNQDGYPDIFAARTFGISLFLGGQEGFTLDDFFISSGSLVQGITSEDFNKDGVIDIVFRVSNSGIWISKGREEGGFDDAVAIPVVIAALQNNIVVADINQDSHLDLILIGGARIFSVLGNGDGTFNDPQSFNIGFTIENCRVADVNGDGFFDVLTATRFGVSVIYGDGTGSFSNLTQFRIGDIHLQDLELIDLDRDDVLDIVTGGTNDNIYVLTGQTTGSFGDYASPDGDYSQLIANADGTVTHQYKNGTRIDFDMDGRQAARTDRNGRTFMYSYDDQDRLVTIRDPRDLETTFIYGADNRLNAIIDPFNRQTNFEHDANGNLTRIMDPDGSFREFDYDTRHRLTAQRSKRNFETVYAYDFAGRHTRATLPDGTIRKVLSPQTVGLANQNTEEGTAENPLPFTRPQDARAFFTDGRGYQMEYAFDGFGAQTLRMDALSQTTITTRDKDSNITRLEQPNGGRIAFTYDTRGNLLTSLQENISALTTFTYEPVFNQITSVTDPLNNTMDISYDVNGNVTETTDAAGTVSKMFYEDANCPGQLTRHISASGLPEESVSRFEYDPVSCNLVKMIDPLSNEQTFAYDAAGNLIVSTDAEQKETRFTYDILNNRLMQVEDADHKITRYSYDADGNLKSVTDANGHQTQFEYDERGRVVRITDPLGEAETYTYDENDNLLEILDRKGQVIQFEYDALNRLTRKVWPDNAESLYDYDSVGNLLLAEDADSRLTFTYDAASRLTQASTAGSPLQPAVPLTYTYDKNGNRKTMADSLIGTTTYAYDVLDRLTALTAPGSQAFQFDYDVLSRRAAARFPNGTESAYAYDVNSRLLSLAHRVNEVPFEQFGYVYDKVGNRIERTQPTAGIGVTESIQYEYDDLYRLIQASNALAGWPEETFHYDALGNRLSRDGQVADSAFDAANRLLEDEQYTYQYDDNGNLTQKSSKTNAADTTVYSYDPENQLIRVDLPDGSRAEYAYDALGRRIEKTLIDGQDTTRARYVYDGDDILFEFDPSAGAGQDGLTARYTHGAMIDEPLLMERDLDLSGVFEAAERFYYHADGLGSIVDLTDSTGAIAQSYVYDAFGQILTQGSGLENPYTYTGREYDSESGLYYYRARYYDPVNGRFLQEDPLGYVDGMNLYAYVRNNPINFVDPLGLYGTNDCSYYKKRCEESGGEYYCEIAQKACNDWFPKKDDPDPNRDDDYEGWTRCTRQCLQDCDAEGSGGESQNHCDEGNGNDKKPDRSTDSFWDWQNFQCHVKCYTICTNPATAPKGN